jgi:hypothetical protein
MKKSITLAALVVCVLALTAPLGAAPPQLSVVHQTLEVNTSACVGQATTAMLAAGFRDTDMTQTSIMGQTNQLTASITCVSGGGRSLAIIAVSGPAASGNATSMMAGRLRNALGGAPVRGASAPKPAPAKRTSSLSWNIDLPGRDYRSLKLAGGDPKRCLEECSLDNKCVAWTWVKNTGTCWLKNAVPAKRQSSCCVSGVMH